MEVGFQTKMQKTELAYLRIQVIQGFDGLLDVALVDMLLDLLARLNRRVLLLGLEVGLFRKLCRRHRVSLHGEVVEDQGVDVAV